MTNRILIISAGTADIDCLAEALGRAPGLSFIIERVGSLSEALARLGAGGIDVILLALALPDSQGLASFDALFAAVPHIPIITLTTRDDEPLAAASVARGAQGSLAAGHFGSSLVPQSLCNIIQRKAVEENLFIERERARITLDSISDAVVGTDMRGCVEYLNRAAERILGWSLDEARGRAIGEVMPLINGETRQPAHNPIERVLEDDIPQGLVAGTLLVRRDGGEVALEDCAAPIHDAGGKSRGAVMMFHDISLAKAMAQEMVYLAHHDFLTRLPNRVLLHDRITQAIGVARRQHGHLAVLFLDLDNFKHINDSLGHEIGDQLLQSVARTLCLCVRSADSVSRQGGDEFVILVSHTQSPETASLSAEKILQAMSAPHAIAGHVLHVSVSIGISVFPDDGEDAETLLNNADTAMYHAKEAGRGTYLFFRPEMNRRALERQSIEAGLRLALERGEFVLHYQPKVDLASGLICGAEALVRWQHPQWGTVPPDRFVPIAEACGLIVPLGRWILREACAQARRWQAAGLAPTRVAVNVSALEFRHKAFVAGVVAILAETGLDPACLELEITETILMHDVDASTRILHQLKALGLHLAVDDFGTGYSSLSYLQEFPIDVLKIDRSFVKDIGSPRGNGSLVSAVIAIGTSLGQRVVAEGVEDVRQLAFLKAQHCHEGQGFIFSRPLLPEPYAALLSTGLPVPSGIDLAKAAGASLRQGR